MNKFVIIWIIIFSFIILTISYHGTRVSWAGMDLRIKLIITTDSGFKNNLAYIKKSDGTKYIIELVDEVTEYELFHPREAGIYWRPFWIYRYGSTPSSYVFSVRKNNKQYKFNLDELVRKNINKTSEDGLVKIPINLSQL